MTSVEHSLYAPIEGSLVLYPLYWLFESSQLLGEVA